MSHGQTANCAWASWASLLSDNLEFSSGWLALSSRRSFADNLWLMIPTCRQISGPIPRQISSKQTTNIRLTTHKYCPTNICQSWPGPPALTKLPILLEIQVLVKTLSELDKVMQKKYSNNIWYCDVDEAVSGLLKANYQLQRAATTCGPDYRTTIYNLQSGHR